MKLILQFTYVLDENPQVSNRLYVDIASKLEENEVGPHPEQFEAVMMRAARGFMGASEVALKKAVDAARRGEVRV